MAIHVRCSGCGKSYQLADEQAGLRVRCRQCANEFEVPRPVERLETVAPQPSSRRPLTPFEQKTISDALSKPKDGRRWLYVGGGIAATLALLMLMCAGTVTLLVSQSQRAAQMAAAELAKAQEELRKELDEKDRKDREARDKERKDKEDADRKERLAQEQRIAELEKKVVKQGGIDLEKLDLQKLLEGGNLDDLMAQLGEDQQARLKGMLAKLKRPGMGVKNIDDAIKKLNSANIEDRREAVAYITTAIPPNDAVKTQAVTDALNKIIRTEEDEVLRNAAETAKLLWN